MNLKTQNSSGIGAPSRASRVALIPCWLLYTLAGMFFYGVWGIQSKIVTEHVSPLANQVLSTPGLLLVTLVLWLRRETEARSPDRRLSLGIFCAFITGIFGAAGNITFYEALRQGSKASVVVPLTTLYPMVTVFLALAMLKEKINASQRLGIVLAVAAIVILGG